MVIDHCACRYPSRRDFVVTSALAALAVPFLHPARGVAAGPAKQPSVNEARRRLVAGNARFVNGKSAEPDYPDRRHVLAAGQSPYVIILGCSDSRVPPEVVFDQGLGDAFTIRVAGNFADDADIGSMEYAVRQFGTPLIVVLGHEKCGAVTATVEALTSGSMPGPHIRTIVDAIAPAVRASAGRPGDPIENAVRANVESVVATLKGSLPVLKPAIDAGRLSVIGAEYALESGKVTFFG